ncbi:MAG: acyl-CoA thioesterase [Anaerolineae bacterium]|nr:acyl-CoA thioesterase [Anaerolineae bacterium]MCB9106258.1 acyl-CoA thioesterase [Anaerolineales bacterium]
MTGKRVLESQVALNQLMLPEHANPMGSVHGGNIMKLVDETGGLCAMRHSRRPVVTVAMDSMTFHQPVNVGDMLMLEANMTWVGSSSMEVEVMVKAENLLTGEQTHTNTAYLVYVALDDTGRTTSVPPLLIETEQEKRRWQEAKARQRRRIKASKPL